jgi:L-arabinose isomerase
MTELPMAVRDRGGQLLPTEPRPISALEAHFRLDTPAVDEWCNAWLRAGASHHMGAGRGRWTPQLLELAQMQGIEAVIV